MDEYVDREAVKNAVTSHWTDCSRILEAVLNIPAADVAPVVHGKWEWVNEDRYRCDRCEQITAVDECMGKPIYNFCPNCGARMDGKEPDNEASEP